jgi:hypothetical protein
VDPPPADFSITATPTSQTTACGCVTYALSIGALNGFNGTVNLSAAGLPAGATATFSPTTITGSGSVTLSVCTTSSTPAGNYTITITATSGSLTHSVTVLLVVTDFTLSATPASQTVSAGSSTTYTLSTTAVNGFTDAVSLSVSGLPAGATGTFSPTSIGGAGSSTLTVSTSASTPAGTYTLTITGTDGCRSHSVTVTLVVNPAPDFTITATPTSQTTACGCVNYTISISPLNGFNGTVNFSASGLPAGATATFSPTTVTGSGSVTITICTTSSTPAGNYTITITGTNGSLTHSVTVLLVVTDFTLSVTPASQTVTAGGNTTYTLSTTAVNGFADAASLSVSGLPTGATGAFSPTSITGAGSSTLTVSTVSSTPAGTYTLTITATDGCRSHSVTVTLVVNAPPPPAPTISGLSVSSGPVGTTVTVSGANFGSSQGTSTLTFNGTAATVSSWGPGTLITTVPTGATTGPVVVTVSNAGSNSLTFTVTTPTPFFMTTASSSTSGLKQLATTTGSAGNFPSSDLVNQPAGDYLIQDFDTQAGVPGVAYTWTSGVNASFVVWMQQTAGTTGTLFPELKLFLNSPSGTPICSVIGATALTTTNTQYNLSCAPGANVTLSNTDRYYVWVGVSSTSASSSSLKSQFNVGSQARGKPVSSVTCPD